MLTPCATCSGSRTIAERDAVVDGAAAADPGADGVRPDPAARIAAVRRTRARAQGLPC
jgi:hypothetical protein